MSAVIFVAFVWLISWWEGGMVVLDGFPNEAEYDIDARPWIVGTE